MNIYDCHTTKVARVMRYLRLNAAILFFLSLTFIPGGCGNAELWREMPQEIANFINQYFPNSELGSFSNDNGTYHARIHNGAGMTFDANYKWTDVDGYGVSLPEVLLFDQLPPKIYQYLQETEELSGVYAIHRTKTLYTITLLRQDLNYDIATGELTGTVPL